MCVRCEDIFRVFIFEIVYHNWVPSAPPIPDIFGGSWIPWKHRTCEAVKYGKTLQKTYVLDTILTGLEAFSHFKRYSKQWFRTENKISVYSIITIKREDTISRISIYSLPCFASYFPLKRLLSQMLFSSPSQILNCAPCQLAFWYLQPSYLLSISRSFPVWALSNRSFPTDSQRIYFSVSCALPRVALSWWLHVLYRPNACNRLILT